MVFVACCHMALVFAVMYLCNIFDLSLLLSILFSLFLEYLFFTQVLMKFREWPTIPVCPGFMCFFNRGNMEGTNSLRKKKFDVCDVSSVLIEFVSGLIL